MRKTLFSLGFYGMALGEALWIALLIWPYVLQNDVFLWPYFLAIGLVLLASGLLLAGLLVLRVRWFLAVGAWLCSLLVAWGEAWLFPHDPTYATAYWSLTYGSTMVALSLLLLGWATGGWQAYWRTLLVASTGAAIAIAFLFVRGPGDWEIPLSGLDTLLVSLVLGVFVALMTHRLTRAVGTPVLPHRGSPLPVTRAADPLAASVSSEP